MVIQYVSKLACYNKNWHTYTCIISGMQRPKFVGHAINLACHTCLVSIKPINLYKWHSINQYVSYIERIWIAKETIGSILLKHLPLLCQKVSTELSSTNQFHQNMFTMFMSSPQIHLYYGWSGIHALNTVDLAANTLVQIYFLNHVLMENEPETLFFG